MDQFAELDAHNSAFLVELADRLAEARSLHRAPRRQAAPEMTRRLHEASMSPQAVQAFLDGLPRMRAALLNSRQILGPVAYARHMHELDTDERDAKAILRRAQLRVVAGTAFDD